MQMIAGPQAQAFKAAQRGQAVRRVRSQAAAVDTVVKAASTSRDARQKMVQDAGFAGALDVDSFIGKVETALLAQGFKGSNSIAVTNLCRDEATAFLRDAIERSWGSSFNVMGLGGVLTCGCTGFGAGFSHSPVCPEGRERYVFFSLPHIAVSETGQVGAMARPGRPAMSAACGAMLKLLGELKSEGVSRALTGGLYDTADPEYSILKNRCVTQAIADNTIPSDLVEMTKLGEKAITGDLEWLISKTVNTDKADYAVFTGVQIHNWADDLNDANRESFEFVYPVKAYAVVNGKRVDIDLSQVKPSDSATAAFEADVTPIESPYFMSRLIGNGHTKPGAGSVQPESTSAPSTPKKQEGGFLKMLGLN